VHFNNQHYASCQQHNEVNAIERATFRQASPQNKTDPRQDNQLNAERPAEDGYQRATALA
jgi:hypothetical protein